MPYDPILAVKFAAFDAALRARINDLDQEEVDALRERAEREIPDPANPLRRAIIGFVTQYEIARHDAQALYMLGETLRGYIDSSNMPMPADIERRDIHG